MRLLRLCVLVLISGFGLGGCCRVLAAQASIGSPIEVRVLVITMFEVGADTGDAPGEFQFWVEREHLTESLPMPAGYRPLRLNRERGILGMVTGVGNSRAAASVMALGLDPRFDLSHAYVVVAGIAGIDPHVGSLGSVAWADWVIDGDLLHEIDAREIPQTTAADRARWTTGYVPLGKDYPFEQPRADRFGDDGVRYALNGALAGWAYGMTRSVELLDTPEITARRQQYLRADVASPAHRAPFVLKGADISASTFWHGRLMSEWAHRWVEYETGEKGTYTVCGMEDSGTMQSLTFLAQARRVDLRRVLVLRAASNYDQQRDGIAAAESLAETKVRNYSAYLPALENAYRVGHVVVDALADGWGETRDRVPGSAR